MNENIQRGGAETQRCGEKQININDCIVLLSLLAMVVCFTGCIMSESPFYLESQIVEDKRIEGSFVNTNDSANAVWSVAHGKENDKKYLVRVNAGDTSFELTGTLFRVNGTSFLDLFPLREMPLGNASGNASPISQLGHALMSEKKHLVVKVELADEDGIFWCPAANATGFAAHKAPELKLKMIGKLGVLILRKSAEESQKYLLQFAKGSSVFNSENRLMKKH